MVDDLIKLRDGLSGMPVPEPKPGFVDRVLGNATGPKNALPRRSRGAMPRSAVWWVAVPGALAAAITWVALMWLRPGTPQEQTMLLELNESREVSLVIDSERLLEDATIRLYVSGSVSLSGYEGEHEIEWLTTLTQGANLLSLPVIAHAPGDGRVVAVIEHHGRTRRVSVAMHVLAPG